MTLVVNRVRRKTSKVKTGCFTCRQRRVKCDEEKPSCRRCRNFGRECDGYPRPKDLAAAAAKPLLAVRPRGSSLQFIRATTSPMLQRHVFSTRLDAAEGQMLAFFQHHTATRLGKSFRSRVWEWLALQLVHHESVILDAVVAVASLHRASLVKEVTPDSDSERSSLQRFALNRYSRALHRLRSNITDPSHTYPESVILISCLLFVCFESLQGKQTALMIHLRNGLRIIHDAFRSELEFATTYHSAVVMRGVRKDAIDDLVSIFSQLDYFASLRGNTGPLSLLADAQDDGIDSDPPDTSSSVEELRRNLDALAIDLSRLQNELFGLASKAVSADPNAPLELGAREAYVYALTRFVRLEDMEEDFNERHTKLQKQLEGLDAVMRDPTGIALGCSESEMVPLQHRFVLTRFLTANLRNTHENKSDEFLSSFTQMISLAEKYCANSKSEPETASTQTFHLQKGILRTIYLIAAKCREPTVRRRAIALLRNSAFQDSMWKSAVIALQAEHMADLEEEAATRWKESGSSTEKSLTPADIPEEARFCDSMLAGKLTHPAAARLVLAKYIHVENEAYPKILIMSGVDAVSEKAIDIYREHL